MFKTKFKKYINKLISDSYYRTMMIVTFSSSWNMIYACYHMILALMYKDYWFLTMGVYYFTVCLMKIIAMKLDEKNTSKTLKTNGLMMFGLAIIFSGIVCLTIIEKRNDIRNTIVAITMATYTFYYVINAILNITNKKTRTVRLIVIRNISMVYALGSLYGLERMLLGTFGNINDHFTLLMETISGSVIFIFIVLFGINSLILSKKYSN